MISKEEFLTLAEKGWEKYDYTFGQLYNNYGGIITEDTTSACIIGAACAAANDFKIGTDACEWAEAIFPYDEKGFNELRKNVAYTSNDAGSKEAALKAVEAIEWPVAYGK